MYTAKEDIINTLINHKIKPSYQRIKVLEYLVRGRSHPTVEEIYSALVGEIPTLSKTTVYNTLDLFILNNVAQLISIEDHEARYDANISSHGHFKCLKCGKIDDFTFDFDVVLCSSLEQYSIREKHLYFKGVCPRCLD